MSSCTSWWWGRLVLPPSTAHTMLFARTALRSSPLMATSVSRRALSTKPVSLLAPAELRELLQSSSPPVVLDASWHMPSAGRYAWSEYRHKRIEGAGFWDVCVPRSSSPPRHLAMSDERPRPAAHRSELTHAHSHRTPHTGTRSRASRTRACRTTCRRPSSSRMRAAGSPSSATTTSSCTTRSASFRRPGQRLRSRCVASRPSLSRCGCAAGRGGR